MSKRKAGDEERRRSFAADVQQPQPLGAFSNGRRVTSPTGNFVAMPRPISQLASRMRGVCCGSVEDAEAAESPRAISAGGIAKARSLSSSLGRRVNLPRELLRSRGATTPLLRSIRFVDAPDLAALSAWVAEVRSLTKAKKRGGLRFAPRAAAIAADLFRPESQALLRSWQRHSIGNAFSLEDIPTVAVGIENVTEQPQLARVATLLHALMQFKVRVEQGAAPAVCRGKELGNMESFHFMFHHVLSPDTKGVDRHHYYEGTRHVIVGFRQQFYEFEVFEPQGRLLVASEIHQRLQLLVANAGNPPCSLPIASLSSLPREEFRRVTAEMAAQCAANKLGVGLLDSSICFVGISEDGSETLEWPSLAVPRHEVRWLGKSTSLVVFPNGNAALRCDGTAIDAASAAACAKWIANAANCDPMLQPPAAAAETVQAMRRTPRTPTPTGAAPRRAPKGKPAPVVEEVPEVTSVAIQLPPPPPAAQPRPVPLWMPREFCQGLTAAPAAAPSLRSFDVSLKNEFSLHLGCLLALHFLRPAELPVVHVAQHSATRDPVIVPTLTTEVEVCLRYVEQFTQFGPLRTEVNLACRAAVARLRESAGEVGSGTRAHISNARALRAAGALDAADGGDAEFARGGVLGPPDLLLVRHPHEPELLWTLSAGLVPAAEAPVTLNYTIAPAHRSSLKRTLGGIATCTLINANAKQRCEAPAAGDQPVKAGGQDVTVEELMQSIKLFVKFVDDSIAAAEHRAQPSTAALRAATPELAEPAYLRF